MKEVRGILIALCTIGTILLVAAPIACWFANEKVWLWLGMLVAGEAIAWFGAGLILLKFFT